MIEDSSAAVGATGGDADVGRITALAEESLGDASRAASWLRRPNQALGNIAPLGAVKTNGGRRAVENLLGRIGHGGIS